MGGGGGGAGAIVLKSQPLGSSTVLVYTICRPTFRRSDLPEEDFLKLKKNTNNWGILWAGQFLHVAHTTFILDMNAYRKAQKLPLVVILANLTSLIQGWIPGGPCHF